MPIDAQNNSSEKIKSIKTVTGKFVRFEWGDYLHADIKKSNGKTKSFWMGGIRCLQCFMAVNQGKTLTFTYEVVDTYIPEGSGRMVTERIKSARIGNLTFEKWWNDLRKKYSVKQIEKKYEVLVNKYTK